MHTIMITVETENYNHISQDFYNNTINSLDLALIPCTCGHSGCLIHHGVYKRSIQLADTLITLSVIRIYCKECGHTHALLLSSMVPYFQIPLQLYVNTIIAAEHQTGFASLLDGRVCVRTVTGGIPLFDRFVQAGFRMFLTLFQAVHAD